MVFNSLTYLYFLLTVWILHWLIPARGKLGLLLVASFVFYCSWRWEYGFLLLLCMVVNFTLSHIMRGRQSILIVAILFNLSLLGYYKYLGFFAEMFNSVADPLDIGRLTVPRIILPLAISFFTFHAMSYVIDVYRGDRAPERSFLRFALYQAFWPHLIAGPILRSHEIIPQFETPWQFRYEDFAYGSRRILEGLFKKVVLADNLAFFVNEGFKVPGYMNNTALDTWALAFGFGLQIYFDFSAYSDIAIGSARLFGYSFSENFNYPYLAASPREFWNRWHITLSSWIRDYLYIPLQGLRRQQSTAEGGINIETPLTVNQRRRNVALFATWGLMGLWHGANWTFVWWGLWHACCIFLFRIWEWLTRCIPALAFMWMPWLLKYVLGLFLTTLGIMIGWLFFRSTELSQAVHMVRSVLIIENYQGYNLHPNFHAFTAFCLFSVYGYYMLEQLVAKRAHTNLFTEGAWVVNSVKYVVMATLVIAFFKQGTTFIYFQF